jgi:4-hydroxybenzoate polyprenyltransferase
MILLCTVGFAALSIGASGTYILNDLFDISDDRKHPRKKFRSLASGRISILNGGLLAICLIAVSIISSYFLNSKFFVILLIYYFLTLSYSFVLKRYILIDSILLASLYTLRVIAGAQLTNVELSFWLMSFSIFIFFSLALIKRCTELQLLENIGKKYAEGRDYNTLDISSLRSMGISSGFLSVIVFAMYINSTDVLSLYSNPKILWLICPALLYLVNRLWIKTGRGEMHDDPIVFALEDRASQLIVAIVVCLILISTYL